MTVHFASSPYTPLAISFAGLGIGYVILGGQTLFRYPPPGPNVDRAVGIWAVTVPGIIQLISAFILFVGMTWFGVFTAKPYAYFLIVAFLSYSAHWFGMGLTRYAQADERIEGWMGIPFCAVSVLGVWVMLAAGDVAVAIAFVLLALVYAADALYGFKPRQSTQTLQGFVQFCTGWWLIYLVWAIVLNYTGTLRLWM